MIVNHTHQGMMKINKILIIKHLIQSAIFILQVLKMHNKLVHLGHNLVHIINRIKMKFF